MNIKGGPVGEQNLYLGLAWAPQFLIRPPTRAHGARGPRKSALGPGCLRQMEKNSYAPARGPGKSASGPGGPWANEKTLICAGQGSLHWGGARIQNLGAHGPHMGPQILKLSSSLGGAERSTICAHTVLGRSFTTPGDFQKK